MELKLEQLEKQMSQEAYSVNLHLPLENDDKLGKDLLNTLMESISKFLGVNKSRDEAKGLVFADDRGNFKMGAIVKYHPGESDDQPGNWSYEMTFNEEDMDGVHTYGSNDTSYLDILAACARNNRFSFKKETLMAPLMHVIIDAIKNVLEANVTEGEECQLEVPGCFTAAAGIEDDEKLLSITPSGEMKRLIKDDSALEKY